MITIVTLWGINLWSGDVLYAWRQDISEVWLAGKYIIGDQIEGKHSFTFLIGEMIQEIELNMCY